MEIGKDTLIAFLFAVVFGTACADYVYIDLSGGPEAVRYPWMRMAEKPAGGWTDEWKTTKLVFRRVEPGSFRMGSPESEKCRDNDERSHDVTLTRPYYLAVFETTQRQWELVTGRRPSLHRGVYSQRPVEHVSWNDVRGEGFLGKLRTKTGLFSLDLPTEAQWEYACRAGTTNAFYSGKDLTVSGNDPGMNPIGRYWFTGGWKWRNAKTADDAGMGTALVGSYMPNAWGFYDLSGNVLEWTLDRYGAYPAGPVFDPKGPTIGDKRVMRGGGLFDSAYSCRSAARHGISSDARTSGYGFRLAIPYEQNPLSLVSNGVVKAKTTFTLPVTGANGTYPVPDELRSTLWRMRVNGAENGVGRMDTFAPLPFRAYPQDYGGEYGFSQFEMSTAAVLTVTASVPREFRTARLLPANVPAHIRDRLADGLSIVVDRPCKFAIVFADRRHPLLVFALPPETDVPDPKDPRVRVFEPGLTEIPGDGKIVVGSGETLYFKPGAFVRGGITATGENIRICGRGFIDDTPLEWVCRRTSFAIGVENARHVRIEDVGVCGSGGWTIATKNAEDVLVRDVKLCNSRIQNDDGIDPCNTRHMRIENCFIRTDDDCIAIKGSRREFGDCEDIVICGCTLWCDRARCILMGHESRAEYMRNILVEDCDVIHVSQGLPAFLLEPGEDMRLEDVVFRNIRVYNDVPGREMTVVSMRPQVNYAMERKVAGHIRGILFENLTVSGEQCRTKFVVEGRDAEHVTHDVRFKNVRVFGKPLERHSDGVVVGEFAEGVFFEQAGAL